MVPAIRASFRMNQLTALFLILALAPLAGIASAEQRPGKIESRSGLQWVHLSSAAGDLPVPGPSTEQTGALVADLDRSGGNGFVLSFRKTAPALVWYRRNKSGWDRYVIDKNYLTVEAGGAVYDIDGDGYPDIVFGADYQGDELWWWQNPAGHYNPNVPWKRHIIKKGGAHQHHDQIFGDFEGAGKPQLVFWNQGAKTLFIAPIPANPRHAKQWKFTPVYSGGTGEGRGPYAEGLAAADMEGDGKLDILAGNYWFQYVGHGHFNAYKIADFGGRIAAARLIKGSKYPHVLINSGDGVGPLKWYECKGDPKNAADWIGHDLVGRNVVHGHSLQIADIDGDGNLDIFAAEMAKWTEKRTDPDNPSARAWIFFGDGHGHFRKTEFAKGIGFHEARIADLNGDGLMDVLDKPYNWRTPRVDVWLQQPGHVTGIRQERVPRIEAQFTIQPKFDVSVSTDAKDLPDNVRHDLDLVLAGAQAPADAGKAPHRINIGLQLYSVRNQLTADLGGTLAKVHDFGITDVETAGFYGHTAAQFRKALDAHHLHASGGHWQWDDFSNHLDQVIQDAHTLGAEYVTLPWIPHTGAFTLADAHRAAAKFNEWGRKCSAAGLHFCYHPHGYEFRPTANGTAFDVLMRETDPKYANFELDIFWAYHGGADPVKLMQAHPTRFVLMHVKDMRKSVKTPKYTGSENVENDVAMGTGQLDLPAILAEAEKIGIKHYYIEDESSRSLEQIPQSIRYVRSIGF